ncbi:MAG: tetratricopeptide repeat protein [Bacteroidota bacterium]
MRIFTFGLLLLVFTACSLGETDGQQTIPEGAAHEYNMLLKEIKALEDTLKKSETNIDKVSAMELIAKSEAFASGFASDPKAPFMLFRAADVARGIGVHDLAIQHWETIYNKYPEYERRPEARFMIAYTYENDLKNIEKAKANYNAFLENHPEHKMADQVRQILTVIDKSPEELVREFQKNQPEN